MLDPPPSLQETAPASTMAHLIHPQPPLFVDLSRPGQEVRQAPPMQL